MRFLQQNQSNKLSLCRCFALFVCAPIITEGFFFFMECSQQTEKHGKKIALQPFLERSGVE